MLGYLQGAVETGLLYALMALGVYMTFRILEFPDLTVDGSFTTGGAIAAVMITHGYSPWVATVCALLGGMAAGAITGLLHTKGKINGLLSGILMMIALYSINMRILGKPNMNILDATTVFSSINVILFMVILIVIVKVLIDGFFKTDLGLALRATGDNPRMIGSLGANTDNTKIIGISISNGLVALSGAVVAQEQGYADIGMGIGMIVVGLASVIIGEAVFGSLTVFRATLAAILGSVVYRIVIASAYQSNLLKATDIKLITAIIVVIALVVPSAHRSWKQKNMARQRSAELSGGDR